MLTIERKTFCKAWVELLWYLTNSYTPVFFPRGLKTQEQLGVTFRVTESLANILNHEIRNLNYKFMVAEWLWIMSGSNDLQEIAQYNSQLAQFSDDGKVLAGAYGPRLAPHLEWILQQLHKKDSRQAVCTIWTNSPALSKDLPCTVAAQFLLRDDELNMIVTMRSSDVWLGLPYDFYTFSQIQNCLAGLLSARRGFAQFNLGSSHLYDENKEAALKIVTNPSIGSTCWSDELPHIPPVDLYRFLRDPNGEFEYKLVSPWTKFKNVLAGSRSDAIRHLTHAS